MRTHPNHTNTRKCKRERERKRSKSWSECENKKSYKRENIERWSRVGRLLCKWSGGNPNSMHLLPMSTCAPIHKHISHLHLNHWFAYSTFYAHQLLLTSLFRPFSVWLRIKLCFIFHLFYLFVYAIDRNRNTTHPSLILLLYGIASRQQRQKSFPIVILIESIITIISLNRYVTRHHGHPNRCFSPFFIFVDFTFRHSILSMMAQKTPFFLTRAAFEYVLW